MRFFALIIIMLISAYGGSLIGSGEPEHGLVYLIEAAFLAAIANKTVLS